MIDLTAHSASGRGDGVVTALLHDAAAACPDAVAVSDSTGRWTYAELATTSRAVANWLLHNGIRPGDRVLVRLGNQREFVAALFGVLLAGGVAVPINPAMRPYLLSGVLGDAEPALVVTTAEDVPVCAEAGAGRVVVGDRLVAEALAATTEPVLPTVSPTDLALLIYTSGSTSAPKAVVCPHQRVVFAAHAIADRLGYRGTDRVLTAVPLSFDYGLYQIFLAIIAGAELVLTDATSPVRLMTTLRERRATVLPIVPSLGDMLVRLAARGEPPDHVRLFTNTGAALTAPTIAGLRSRFPEAAVVPMYGITECKRVTVAEPDGDLRRPGSVGRPLDGTWVSIEDEDGNQVPAGAIGEIVVGGPHVMAGYWRAPELTAGRFGTDPAAGHGILRTGDYGHLDADGHLYFDGRRDDQFKRRGTRMSTIEIETAARDITGVTSAAVLPPTAERDVVLFVTGDLDAGKVLDGLAARLEPAKVPDVCHLLTSFPLTANGKVDKKALAVLAAGGDHDR
ncbi:MAG TPA: AMP-binding protein [Pseudonocardiaceae bacterium]|jgi:amino acid adenylation domain-containing protein